MQDDAPPGRVRANDPLPGDVGRRLRAVREEPGIGLRELSRRLGASSSWVPIAARPAGREYGLVLSGRIRVTLGAAAHVLGPEDSIAFDTSLPHRIDNIGDEPATAVWRVVGPGPP